MSVCAPLPRHMQMRHANARAEVSRLNAPQLHSVLFNNEGALIIPSSLGYRLVLDFSPLRSVARV